MKINWIEVDEIMGRGHGIEIYHRDCPRGKMIAFIYGYAWIHKTVDETLVEILKPNCKLFEENEINGQEIIDEIRKFVTNYLTGSRTRMSELKLLKRPKKIALLFNA